jgi:hypothetical protein
MEDVAKALKDGDARTAAAELEKLAGGRLGEGAKDGSGTDAEQLAREKDLDHLLRKLRPARASRTRVRYRARR